MVQAGRDKQPFQKAIQKQPDVARCRNEARDRCNALLHRRPGQALGKTEKRRRTRHAGERPPCTGKDTGKNAFAGAFAGAVKDPRRYKPQQDAAEYAGVHGLDAQHGGLAGTGQAGQAVGLCQQAQLIQGHIAGRERNKIAHQGDQPRLMFIPPGQRGGNADAEQYTEVVDDGRQALVDQLPQQAYRRPAQKRQDLRQRRAGEQRPRHQQQPRRRKIGQRRKHRLGKALQRRSDPVFHVDPSLSRQCLSVVNRRTRKMSRAQIS